MPISNIVIIIHGKFRKSQPYNIHIYALVVIRFSFANGLLYSEIVDSKNKKALRVVPRSVKNLTTKHFSAAETVRHFKMISKCVECDSLLCMRNISIKVSPIVSIVIRGLRRPRVQFYKPNMEMKDP